MYQFSDSDSVDSDEGIRYKTESIRNKAAADRNKRERESSSRRERKRSRSRSRSRHHAEKKKRKSDHSPDDKSYRKTSRSVNRENDERERVARRNRREKDESRKEVTSLKKELVVEEKEEKSSDNCPNNSDSDKPSYGPTLPQKEENDNHERPTEGRKRELQFGPALPPATTESLGEEQSQNGDTLGPQLLSPLVKKSHEDAIVGPVLPSHFITVSSLEDDSTSDLDDKHITVQDAVIGPAVPPNLLKQSEENVIGPAIPLHLRQRLENSSDGPKEEDEDVYGPVPDGAHYSRAHIELEERALKLKIDQLGPSDTKEPVREEWMLTLPEAKASNFGLGPRQFRSKAGPDMSDRSSWTDTPEDKAKKKVGKIEPVIDLKREAELKTIQKRDREQEKIAKEQKKEKNSLLEIHRKKLKKEKKNEGASKERRPFSREVDLQVNRFDEAQKKAVLKKAQLLDTRFSSGESKFL